MSDEETRAILARIDELRDEYHDDRPRDPSRETRMETLVRLIEERDRNREGRNALLRAMTQ